MTIGVPRDLHPPRYDSAGNSSMRVCRQDHISSKWNVRIGTRGWGSRGSSLSHDPALAFHLSQQSPFLLRIAALPGG